MNFELTTPGATAKTMTLKEITDLLDVRHDKAMLKVAAMALEPEFGWVSKMDIQYSSGKGRIDTVETYQLDKRQSIAVSARLNVALLMRIVDRWQALEEKQHTLAQDAMAALESMRGSMAAAGQVIQRLESVLAQIAPAQLPPQDAREAAVINYLMRKGEISGREFQRCRTNAKPWSGITPKSAIGGMMRETFAELEQKGVITRNGNSIRLNTIH